VIMKKCTQCKEEKSLDQFRHRSDKKHLLKSICRGCDSAKSKKYRNAHPEVIRAHCKKNHERRKKNLYEWRKKNRERAREISRRWALLNPEKVKITEKRKIDRYKTDPIYRVSMNMSHQMYNLLKRKKGGRSWKSLVGYTLEDLRQHIEQQFVDGMSWDNYGEWQVDHIVPKVAFNFEKTEDFDFKRCWALSNLRPMWASDNAAKGCRLSKPFQPSLLMTG
jgi:hypothetical protein